MAPPTAPLLPRVSFVVPTWQRAARVGDAVASVLAQDHPDVEAVVVDDGSTDGTLDGLRRRFGDDPRLRLLRRENGGVARARNSGIDAATGAMVAFLDSDDRCEPTFASTMAARLVAAPDAAAAVCDVAYVGPWADGNRSHFERLPRGLPTTIEHMVLGGWFLITGLLFRADVVRSLRFDPAWYAEDAELMCRFLLAGHRYVVEPRALVSYVRHAGDDGAPQQSQDPAAAPIAAARLESAYVDRCRLPRATRARLHRRWAKRFLRAGLHAEARPHLWAWWRRRPFDVAVAWHLLRGTTAGR